MAKIKYSVKSEIAKNVNAVTKQICMEESLVSLILIDGAPNWKDNQDWEMHSHHHVWCIRERNGEMVMEEEE